MLKGRKYLIAANFKDNEELLPHVIVQIWHLLAILPQGSAFLSIYESGSSDSTGAPCLEWPSERTIGCKGRKA